MGTGKIRSRKLVFDELDCCSLVHAIIFNSALVQFWMDVIPEKKLKLLVDILVSTRKLEFNPSPEIADIYQTFVDAALEKITRETPKLPCRHTPTQHEKALRNLKTQLKSYTALSV